MQCIASEWMSESFITLWSSIDLWVCTRARCTQNCNFIQMEFCLVVCVSLQYSLHKSTFIVHSSGFLQASKRARDHCVLMLCDFFFFHCCCCCCFLSTSFWATNCDLFLEECTFYLNTSILFYSLNYKIYNDFFILHSQSIQIERQARSIQNEPDRNKSIVRFILFFFITA